MYSMSTDLLENLELPLNNPLGDYPLQSHIGEGLCIDSESLGSSINLFLNRGYTSGTKMEDHDMFYMLPVSGDQETIFILREAFGLQGFNYTGYDEFPDLTHTQPTDVACTTYSTTYKLELELVTLCEEFVQTFLLLAINRCNFNLYEKATLGYTVLNRTSYEAMDLDVEAMATFISDLGELAHKYKKVAGEPVILNCYTKELLLFIYRAFEDELSVGLNQDPFSGYRSFYTPLDDTDNLVS